MMIAKSPLSICSDLGGHVDFKTEKGREVSLLKNIYLCEDSIDVSVVIYPINGSFIGIVHDDHTVGSPVHRSTKGCDIHMVERVSDAMGKIRIYQLVIVENYPRTFDLLYLSQI